MSDQPPDQTVKNDPILINQLNKPVPKCGVRHVQIFFLFFLFAIGIGMRVQLGVAIVAMTDNTTSSNPNIPTYNWTNKSIILSSFYWSYFLLQIVGAVMGETLGIKKILAISMGVCSVAGLLIPISAQIFGPYGVILCRIMQGLFQSVFYPLSYSFLGQWSPVLERSRLGAIMFCGTSFGVIVAMPLVGFISASSWGWPSTFYLYGILGLLWVLAWLLFSANSPAEHKSISNEERIYIETDQNANEQVSFQDIPWKAMMTSAPLWALTASFTGETWIITTLITELPIYFNKVMGFDVESDGILTCLPDLASLCSMFFVAMLADFIIKNRYMSIGNTRKAFTVGPWILYCTSIIILVYIPNGSDTLVILILILNGILSSFTSSGASINHVDIAPRYSGITMSISNSICSVFSMIAPLVVQAVVTDETDRSQWKLVFFIAIAVGLSTNAFFLFFASGELQWWNSYKVEKHCEPASETVRKPAISTTV